MLLIVLLYRVSIKYFPDYKHLNVIRESLYAHTVLNIGSTCLGRCYARHQDLTTIVLITTWTVPFFGCCWLEVGCRQAGLVSGLQAIACNPDTYPNGPCGNQHYSRELLMMGITVPETC